MPFFIVREDITAVRADAIVVPTDRGMSGSGPADGAVYRAADAALAAECRKHIPLAPGAAVLTDGYGLPCAHILHVCGSARDVSRGLLPPSLIETLLNAGCESAAFPFLPPAADGIPAEAALRCAEDALADLADRYDITVFLCAGSEPLPVISAELRRKIAACLDSCPESPDASAALFSGICCDILAEDFPDAAEAPRPVPEKRKNAAKKAAADTYAPFVGRPEPGNRRAPDLADALRHMDKPFSETLFGLIDRKGMTDTECYKRANVSRKTFSKIRCDRSYRPSKETVLAFAIALKLTPEETNAFLSTAGYALSRCIKSDVIIGYFLENGIYDINEINRTLYDFDQACLGC